MATSPLPHRSGLRPQTSRQIPHSQLDQQPGDSSLTDAVIDEARDWPKVSEGTSRISVEGARALILDSGAAGPADAFIIETEFCHGHAQGDFSFHAALPPDLAIEATRSGWAEPHFLAATGEVPANIVMIYAPRDDGERATVLDLVRSSYDYALGVRP